MVIAEHDVDLAAVAGQRMILIQQQIKTNALKRYSAGKAIGNGHHPARTNYLRLGDFGIGAGDLNETATQAQRIIGVAETAFIVNVNRWNRVGMPFQRDQSR